MYRHKVVNMKRSLKAQRTELALLGLCGSRFSLSSQVAWSPPTPQHPIYLRTGTSLEWVGSEVCLFSPGDYMPAACCPPGQERYPGHQMSDTHQAKVGIQGQMGPTELWSGWGCPMCYSS